MSDVEDRLGAYRPAGPPPDLRAQIMREVADGSSSRIRDWWPAIATAALIVLFAVLNRRIHSSIDARLPEPDDRRPIVQWLTDDAGGLR
jgi:hypothetical protein